MDKQGNLNFYNEPGEDGFRLKKYEVYNWGPFDGAVHTLTPEGGNLLLTGNVGSGKSTLVDGLAALLVPGKKRSFNKAAGAKAGERSVESYVLGYYKKEQGAAGRAGVKKGLRDKNDYSALLACFRNGSTGEEATLAQFFWWPNADNSTPDILYVFAKRELSICRDFCGFSKIDELKKRLKNSGAEIYASFTPYSERFMSAFGFRSEKASGIFGKTVSMKTIENLTSFVREFMLEGPDPENSPMDDMIKSYDGLLEVRDKIEEAEKQIGALRPVRKFYEERRAEEEAAAEAEETLDAADCWFASEHMAGLLEERLAEQNKELARLQEERERAEAGLRKEEKEKEETAALIRDKDAGRRLAAIRDAAEAKKLEAESRSRELKHYEDRAREAGFEPGRGAEGFRALREALPGEIEKMGAARDAAAEEKAERRGQDREREELGKKINGLKYEADKRRAARRVFDGLVSDAGLRPCAGREGFRGWLAEAADAERRMKEEEAGLQLRKKEIAKLYGVRAATSSALAQARAAADGKAAALRGYNEAAEAAGLPACGGRGDFDANLREARALSLRASEEQRPVEQEKYKAKRAADSLREKIEAAAAEIEELGARRSNIDARAVRLRERLARGTGLPAESFPFAGELMRVKKSEEGWRGAAERALYKLAHSLLVSEQDYEKVSSWVDSNDLKGRLVYYRTSPAQAPAAPRAGSLLCGKIEVKEDSPFAPWLRCELDRNYDYLCCEGVGEFRAARRAVTRSGQMKLNGVLHVKDDGRDINDKSWYALGWDDNAEKREALKAKAAALASELKEASEALHKAEAALSAAEERYRRANAVIEKSRSFDAVDVWGAEAETKKLEEALAALPSEEKLGEMNDEADAEDRRLAKRLEAVGSILEKYVDYSEIDFRETEEAIDEAESALRKIPSKAELEALIEKAGDEYRRLERRIAAAEKLYADFTDFTKMDRASLDEEIKRLEKEYCELEKSSSEELEPLKARLRAVEKKIESLGRDMDRLAEKRGALAERIRESEERLAREKEKSADGYERRRARFGTLEAALKETPEGAAPLTPENAEAAKTAVTNKFVRRKAKAEKAAGRLEAQLLAKMSGFRDSYPVQAREFAVSLDGASDYIALLEKLEYDGLPSLRDDYAQRLRANATSEIGLFSEKLDSVEREIKRSVKTVNEALAQIEYSPGCYIALEARDSGDEDVRRFRAGLRDCTQDAVGGGGGEEALEARFDAIRDLIGKLKSDAAWAGKVTDVRNWFKFGAKEIIKETGEEKEYYSDSSGKSGGEKEKLAYTILAASLAYQFGLGSGGADEGRRFRFVMIDEAFSHSPGKAADYIFQLFRKLGLQLLVVTPGGEKAFEMQPYLQWVVHIDNPTGAHASRIQMTFDEYMARRGAACAA